jgi:sulfoquinovose isomerase
LFARAVAQGWDTPRGGLYYTLEYDGAPRVRDRLWWPVCEGIGAAHFLGVFDGAAFHEDWYRRLWNFAARHLIDRREGGWRPQLDETLAPVTRYFVGKPDIYHALQACLIPLYPTSGSLTRGVLEASAAR